MWKLKTKHLGKIDMPLIFKNKNWMGYYGIFKPLGNNSHLILGSNHIGDCSLSLSRKLNEKRA